MGYLTFAMQLSGNVLCKVVGAAFAVLSMNVLFNGRSSMLHLMDRSPWIESVASSHLLASHESALSNLHVAKAGRVMEGT